ncbi:DNA repair protein RAD57 [Fonsecaea pedrosoi]|nr:DNA repair protein RAD57 [Fonsecaea pedrosoi]
MEFAGPEPEVPWDIEGETPVIRSDPYLVDFTQLGDQIYFYAPPAEASKTEIDGHAETPGGEQQQQQQPQEQEEKPPVADPDLIIVCSWMYAQSRNIIKYTKQYQTRYPSSPILLLRQDGGDFFFRTQAQQMRNLEPAVSLIRDLEAATTATKMKATTGKETGGEKEKEFKVLMHIFSNGGAWSACQLADAYHHYHSQSQHQHQRAQQHDLSTAAATAVLSSSDEAPHRHHHLPITALILDSTPSLPDPNAAHTAICEALPKSPAVVRALGSALVWGYLGVTHAVEVVTGHENVTLSLRRRLNDPRGAFCRCHRAYIYSQADALIPGPDVESHAREAAQVLPGGPDMVRLEDFVVSRHVGHVLADPVRYWAIVASVWEEATR